MRRIQKGFTLIELVVVITILGILAAFAIPRFAALDSAARVSATSALVGSIRSASSLAHAMYLTSGNSATTPVIMEGASVTMVNGYPDLAGIVLALQDTSGFTQVSATPLLSFQKTGAGTVATCEANYTLSSGAGIAPVIAGITTGC
jgi:MSHA pilin protein MshA